MKNIIVCKEIDWFRCGQQKAEIVLLPCKKPAKLQWLVSVGQCSCSSGFNRKKRSPLTKCRTNLFAAGPMLMHLGFVYVFTSTPFRHCCELIFDYCWWNLMHHKLITVCLRAKWVSTDGKVSKCQNEIGNLQQMRCVCVCTSTSCFLDKKRERKEGVKWGWLGGARMNDCCLFLLTSVRGITSLYSFSLRRRAA